MAEYNIYCYAIFNPFTSKISFVILKTVCHTILGMLVRESGTGPTNNSLIYLYIFFCMFDIVKRNSFRYGLTLFCFKDLMNVTEKLQFLDPSFDTPV